MHNNKLGFKHTIFACYFGYITQSIVNCFVPLLFVIFNETLNISLTKITFLVTLNFVVQLLTDLLSAKFVDKIGYRQCIVSAHVLAALGLIGIAILPKLLPNAYIGLIISVFLYATGGGLIEVMVNPIVEACPSDDKKSAISLLHSFYCWGAVGVILFSTLFLEFYGKENWQILAMLWAIIPTLNAVYFLLVPIGTLNEGEKSMSFKQLFSSKLFWMFIVLMLAAGAAEQCMSQWSSAFAESGLKVSKTFGDLLGPCMFAVMMGLARTFYAKFNNKVDLTAFIVGSCVLCVASYLLTALSPVPILSLIGCMMCGASVGILWPGTINFATEKMPNGGTAMFALLALAGDLGCATGPTVVGTIAGAFNDDLKIGLLCGIVFPIIMIIDALICKRYKGNRIENKKLK